MSRSFSLAYLTSAPLSAPDMVRLAARLGYANVGLRLAPAAPRGEAMPLIADAALLAATQATMAETGVAVFDVEIVRIGEGFVAETLRPFLRTAQALGAKAVLTACDDPVRDRLTASYAAFCDIAAEHGLTADLEFMPWTAVKSCNDARAIVEGAVRPNGRILVDSLHAARSATTLEDLRALPRRLIGYVQMCDAPAEVPATTEGLIRTARHARLLPGDGGIDLRAMFAALPDDVPVSLELPNDVQKAQHGIEEWSRLALQKALAVLSSAD
jgi:sugar phosphate isomerase/epimerase